MFAQKKHVQVVLFDLHMRTVGQREALLMGVKRGLAPLAGVQRTASSGKNQKTIQRPLVSFSKRFIFRPRIYLIYRLYNSA